MNIRKGTFAFVVLALFWGLIGLGMVTGLWQTKVSASDIRVENPSDIKGWMTIRDVSATFAVPEEKLTEIFGLPAEVEKNKPLKEIARERGQEISEYRAALSSYLGVEGGQAESYGGE